MNKAALRILGAGSVALCGLVAAAGAAGTTQSPVVRYVGQSTDDSAYMRVAGLFGESDEEKAARLQHEQNQDDAINRLNDKVRDLEETIRNLTGENETLSHRVDQLDDKISRQQKDFEYRLCAMAAQQLGAGTGQGDANAVPCPGSSGGSGGYGGAPSGSNGSAPQGDTSSLAVVPAERSAGAPQRLALGPGVLGTLPADSAGPPPSNMGDTHAEFSAAMNLLAKARYEEAGAAFRGFADAHPKDDLAPQAVYWVGDIAYVQKDFANAARAFAEVIKKYPTSGRAPDSMLKLGQSLIASGQKKEGCTALAALPAKYPHAASAVLSQGSDARKSVCRGVS
jgi:tol-pal system protein YbgF